MARPGHRQAEALVERLGLTYEQLTGYRFAINVALSTVIVWSTLRFIGDSNPMWAIASMIAASEPEVREARRMFRCRLSNSLVGCGAGLVFVLIGGTSGWVLPIALATTVVISANVVRIKTMWRQAPITAAIVIASSITSDSARTGIFDGLHKVAEIIFGCFVGLVVSWLMSKVWLIRPPPPQT